MVMWKCNICGDTFESESKSDFDDEKNNHLIDSHADSIEIIDEENVY